MAIRLIVVILPFELLHFTNLYGNITLQITLFGIFINLYGNITTCIIICQAKNDNFTIFIF